MGLAGLLEWCSSNIIVLYFVETMHFEEVPWFDRQRRVGQVLEGMVESSVQRSFLPSLLS